MGHYYYPYDIMRFFVFLKIVVKFSVFPLSSCAPFTHNPPVAYGQFLIICEWIGCLGDYPPAMGADSLSS